jgi:hypothetical protein
LTWQRGRRDRRDGLFICLTNENLTVRELGQDMTTKFSTTLVAQLKVRAVGEVDPRSDLDFRGLVSILIAKQVRDSRFSDRAVRVAAIDEISRDAACQRPTSRIPTRRDRVCK